MKKLLFRLTIKLCSMGLLSFHLTDYGVLYAQETLACINRLDQESKSRQNRLDGLKNKVDQNKASIDSQQKVVDDLRNRLNAGSATPEEQQKNQEVL